MQPESNIEQQLAETLRDLGPKERAEVLDFARFLKSRKPGSERLDPKQPRPIGLAAGDFTVPEDFDAPLPDDFLKLLAGPDGMSDLILI